MAVDVFAADEQAFCLIDVQRWADLARSALHAQGVRIDTEVSLLFVDEETIAELNSRFLGRSGPTDVLAFPIDDEPMVAGRSPDQGGAGPGGVLAEDDVPSLLGDVVICPAVAAAHAAEHEVTFDDELALLVVHGVLHLLGMDHEEPDEAHAMEQREQELLDRYHRRGR